MEKRIGVVGIVVENREKVNEELNRILSDFGEIIVGRMGVPYREHDISLISLIVDGTSDEVGAMTGQLGNLTGVNLKSALTSKVVKE